MHRMGLVAAEVVGKVRYGGVVHEAHGASLSFSRRRSAAIGG